MRRTGERAYSIVMRFGPALLACWATMLVTAPAVFAAVPPGADRPMAVTSDTPAYCTTLQHLANAAPTPSPEVRRLIAEGQDLCDRGEVRGGIARLRRALVVERHHATASTEATTTPPPR